MSRSASLSEFAPILCSIKEHRSRARHSADIAQFPEPTFGLFTKLTRPTRLLCSRCLSSARTAPSVPSAPQSRVRSPSTCLSADRSSARCAGSSATSSASSGGDRTRNRASTTRPRFLIAINRVGPNLRPCVAPDDALQRPCAFCRWCMRPRRTSGQASNSRHARSRPLP